MPKEFTEQSLWNLCNYMREDGMNISDYVEQSTALLFLKTVEESPRVHIVDPDEEEETAGDALKLSLPEEARWSRLVEYANNENSEDMTIIEKYDEIINALKHDGELAQQSFKNFSSKFNSPKVLRKVVNDIESYDVWGDFANNTEVFGDAYEFLLEKYADKADGAGEYFTPRPLIKTMVKAVDPEYTETVYDPASGTNGFLINSYLHVGGKTSSEYGGEEIMFGDTPSGSVDSFDENLYSSELNHDTYRLGIMNLLLHGIDARKVHHNRQDSLDQSIEKEHDVIIANPPYGGNKSAEAFFDPYVDSSSIELNFLQLIMQSLNENGRAAVIVPEGVLFQQGAEKKVREKLLEQFNLHTILVLPENTFHPYAGVDANVLFFERDSGGTEDMWYYDLRSDVEGIKESNPLTEDMFEEFLSSFDGEREDCERFFKASIGEIEEEDYALNYKTYKEFVYDDDFRDPEDILDELNGTVEKVQDELNELEQLTSDNND